MGATVSFEKGSVSALEKSFNLRNDCESALQWQSADYILIRKQERKPRSARLFFSIKKCNDFFLCNFISLFIKNNRLDFLSFLL